MCQPMNKFDLPSKYMHAFIDLMNLINELPLALEKTLKILKGQSETLNRKRTNNTITNRKQ
jgi:hypothetical protein